MKKVLSLCAAAVLAVVAIGCTKAKGDQLTVWSFTDELKQMIDGYYTPSHPDVKIDYSMTPTEQFTSKLDPVLGSGNGAPDVFALEDSFVRKYVESGLLLDITDIYEANKDKLLAYPTEVGTYNGKVYAMSWQATPGAMFYRRSLARGYLGTDDPATVQKYFSNMDKFLETAELLKENSKGVCKIVASPIELFRPYSAGRSKPWVVDGKLNVDPNLVEYLKVAKTLHDKDYEARAGQWSEGWLTGMKGELHDENGKAIEVFSYFLPTWGLHYVLKQNAPGTAGDWAMIPGPISYRWGGTWVGAWKGTKKVAEAKEFIRYITTDDDFLEAYAKKSGDVVSNLNVVNKIKDNFSEPFLGGQNHYAAFAEMAQHVNGKLTQATDQALDGLFQEAVTSVANNEKTIEQALAEFNAQAKAQLGLQ